MAMCANLALLGAESIISTTVRGALETVDVLILFIRLLYDRNKEMEERKNVRNTEVSNGRRGRKDLCISSSRIHDIKEGIGNH